jgi:hypothetical protein
MTLDFFSPQNTPIIPDFFSYFGFESTLLARQLQQERTQMEAQ